MKWHVLAAVAAVACLALVVVSAGCKTAGSAPAAKATSAACPECKTQTATASITTVNYEKGICPECKTVSTINPALAYTLRNYVGDELGDEVRVCSHCKAVVEKCPPCRKVAKK